MKIRLILILLFALFPASAGGKTPRPVLLMHTQAHRLPPTQDALNRTFTVRFHQMWRRLIAIEALPPEAHEPAMLIVPTNSDAVYYGEAAGDTGMVWFSTLFVHQFLDPRDSRHEYALDESLHELAHSQQANLGALPQWKCEGGAQAWSDEMSVKLYGRSNWSRWDGSYAPFVARVRRQMGQAWIDRGQFQTP